MQTGGTKARNSYSSLFLLEPFRKEELTRPMPALHRFEKKHTHQAREEFPGQDLMMDDVPGTPSGSDVPFHVSSDQLIFVGWHMPRCSMYVIFTYTYHKFRPYLGKYAIH